MFLYDLDNITPVDGTGTRGSFAQQGVAAALPTDAATADNRLIDPVDVTVATNRAKVTDPKNYLNRIYRPDGLQFVGDSQGIENPAISKDALRRKLQAARVFGRGNMGITSGFTGLEPFFQDLLNDKTPTVTAVDSNALLYTFGLDTGILPGMNGELVKGTIPNKAIGMKVDSLDLSVSADELSTFNFGLVSLEYLPNTNAAGTTYTKGTADTPPGAVAPTIPATGNDAFAENPDDGFVGFQAGVYANKTDLTTDDGVLLGAFDGRFSIRHNYQPDRYLRGGRGKDDRGASKFIRGNNGTIDVDFEMNIPYAHQNADAAQFFLTNTNLKGVSIEFDFNRGEGKPRAKLTIFLPQGQFIAMPDPAVTGAGEIEVPGSLRILSADAGEGASVQFGYQVPLADPIALPLQTYN